MARTRSSFLTAAALAFAACMSAPPSRPTGWNAPEDVVPPSSFTGVHGLASTPEGVAQAPWGTFVVAAAAAGRLTEIDPASDTRRTIAANLPIGLAGGPGMSPPYVATGVDVGADGTVYFSANRNNAIYRVRPMR